MRNITPALQSLQREETSFPDTTTTNMAVVQMSVTEASAPTLGHHLVSSRGTKSDVYNRKISCDHYSESEKLKFIKMCSASISESSKVEENTHKSDKLKKDFDNAFYHMIDKYSN